MLAPWGAWAYSTIISGLQLQAQGTPRAGVSSLRTSQQTRSNRTGRQVLTPHPSSLLGPSGSWNDSQKPARTSLFKWDEAGG